MDGEMMGNVIILISGGALGVAIGGLLFRFLVKSGILKKKVKV